MRLTGRPGTSWTYCVSIHAPVKDATFAMRLRFPLWFCFNPRTRKGCDSRLGGRGLDIRRFNPRTRKGCDLNEAQKVWLDYLVSIHAPVKDATLAYSLNLLVITVSIHAPVKDATFAGTPVVSQSKFQSTHP